jgi:hypothetical protein
LSARRPFAALWRILREARLRLAPQDEVVDCRIN